MHLSCPIPEIEIDMVWELRMFIKLTPIGNPYLNSELKVEDKVNEIDDLSR